MESSAGKRSVRLAGRLGRYVRPVTDAWTPSGVQLRLMRGVTDGAGLIRSPFGVRVQQVRGGPVRGMWVRAAGASPARGVVLYAHGGGFVFGSPRARFGLAKRLSAAAGLAVFVLKYRLAPEHPFPAAADDVLAAYRWLLAQGFPPRSITLAGDSAGGQLVASLLNDLVIAGEPMPTAAALFSPVLDLSGDGALRRDTARPDPLIGAVSGARCLRAYLGDVPLTHPRLAILDADKRGWPPILIQAGDTECLLGDSERMAASLAAADVLCELQVWPGQVHVFQSLARYLPEARAALTKAGAFLRDHTQPGKDLP